MQKVHETFDQCCIQTNAATQREVERDATLNRGQLDWRARIFGLAIAGLNALYASLSFGYVCALAGNLVLRSTLLIISGFLMKINIFISKSMSFFDSRDAQQK